MAKQLKKPFNKPLKFVLAAKTAASTGLANARRLAERYNSQRNLVNRFKIALLLFVSFFSMSAEFGNLAELDENLIEEQARSFVDSKYIDVDPKKLVLFGIRLNYSKLIEGQSELVATFINLSSKDTGQPVERVMPSPDKPNESTKVVFTQYQTIELTFNKYGQVIRSNKRQEIYPDPPDIFNKMVSEL